MTRTPSVLDNVDLCPFTVIIDSREQHPYRFTGLHGDSKQRNRELLIQTRIEALPTADYSIAGHEADIAIERKSLEDAYHTFGADRDRFERELDRLAVMSVAAVVVEAGWPSIIGSERPVSRGGRSFSPKSFYRSVIAWQQRYPTVHWWFCDTRNFAERTAFRILQRFWEDRHSKKRKES